MASLHPPLIVFPLPAKVSHESQNPTTAESAEVVPFMETVHVQPIQLRVEIGSAGNQKCFASLKLFDGAKQQVLGPRNLIGTPLICNAMFIIHPSTHPPFSPSPPSSPSPLFRFNESTRQNSPTRPNLETAPGNKCMQSFIRPLPCPARLCPHLHLHSSSHPIRRANKKLTCCGCSQIPFD